MIERNGYIFRDEAEEEAWELYGGSEEEDYGGAFDGFTVTSDADPGL